MILSVILTIPGDIPQVGPLRSRLAAGEPDLQQLLHSLEEATGLAGHLSGAGQGGFAVAAVGPKQPVAHKRTTNL